MLRLSDMVGVEGFRGEGECEGDGGREELLLTLLKGLICRFGGLDFWVFTDLGFWSGRDESDRMTVL